jgi:hypothetical protein
MTIRVTHNKVWFTPRAKRLRSGSCQKQLRRGKTFDAPCYGVDSAESSFSTVPEFLPVPRGDPLGLGNTDHFRDIA